jgi:gas vesicle protein
MPKDEGFFDGLVVGGVIGAAVGLLLAPSAGKEAREKIKETIEGLKTNTDLPSMIDRIQDAIEEGKLAAEEKWQELEKEGE